jgi:hypothetical protein
MIHISNFFSTLTLYYFALYLYILILLCYLYPDIFHLRNHLLPCNNQCLLLLNLSLKCHNMSLCLPHTLLLLRIKHCDLPLKLDDSLHHTLPLFIFSDDLLVVCLLHGLSQIEVGQLVGVTVKGSGENLVQEILRLILLKLSGNEQTQLGPIAMSQAVRRCIELNVSSGN